MRLFQNMSSVLIAVIFFPISIEYLNGSLKYKCFVCNRAEKGYKMFPVLFHLINIEIDLQCANPKPSNVSNQPTCQHLYLTYEIGPRLLQVWFLILPILVNMKTLSLLQ